MVLALVFAQVWGILELTALGSFSRTVRLWTILLAVVAGLYICGPLTLVLQLTWVKLYAALTGAFVGNVARVGGYTVDPFLEELLKVLPLILILSFARVRARWAITDCILIGAALGAGFGLAEDLLRYGALPHLANPDADGWTMGTNLSLPYIPGFMLSLTSWLPAPSASTSIFYGQAGYPWVNYHLVWSALAGLAVGLIAIDRRTVSLIAGGVIAFYIGLDHAAWNAEQAFGSTAREVLAPPLAAIRGVLPFLPLVAIALAYWLDRGRQPGPGALDTLVKRLTATRSAATASAQRWPTQLPGALRSLASIAGVLSIVAALPWVLWFVVGGWPQTASVQKAMTSGIGWTLLRIASVIAFVLLVRRLLAMMREWARVRQQSEGEDIAAFLLRGGTALGALVMLVAAFKSVLAGAGASVSVLHILENCMSGCSPGTIFPLTGVPSWGDPPRSSPPGPSKPPGTHKNHQDPERQEKHPDPPNPNAYEDPERMTRRDRNEAKAARDAEARATAKREAAAKAARDSEAKATAKREAAAKAARDAEAMAAAKREAAAKARKEAEAKAAAKAAATAVESRAADAAEVAIAAGEAWRRAADADKPAAAAHAADAAENAASASQDAAEAWRASGNAARAAAADRAAAAWRDAATRARTHVPTPTFVPSPNSLPPPKPPPPGGWETK